MKKSFITLGLITSIDLIIAVDDDESVLNSLVCKAADLHKSTRNGFTNVLNTWVWDGKYWFNLVVSQEI